MEFEKISNIDLEPILVKAIDNEEGLGWDLDYAFKVSKEYIKFLELCFKNQDIPVVPSKDIDDFWHLHILDTQKYFEDCENYLGYFLHHFPYFGMRGEDDEKNLKTAWKNTLKIYKDNFGYLPDEKIWSGSNRCPNCGVRCRNENSFSFNIRPKLENSL